MIQCVDGIVVEPFDVDHRPVEPAYGLVIREGGTRIAFSGDTKPVPALVEAARGVPAVVSDVRRNGIDDTTLTIKNYCPYATTLFDYIRRSMPWTSPRSLTDDQVYALTAYILAQNHLIDAKEVINAQTLPKVQMPNRNGFIPRFPERMPHD